MKNQELYLLKEAYIQLEKSKKQLSDIQSHLWDTHQYRMLRKVISSQARQLEAQRNIIIQLSLAEPISTTEMAPLEENKD